MTPISRIIDMEAISKEVQVLQICINKGRLNLLASSGVV